MSLVAVCSAHGSPGVTTAALVLAAAWPGDRGEAVVVEADPSGGVVAVRFGLGDTPGLGSLAAASRDGLPAGGLAEHAQELAGGLKVVVGPPAPEQASMVVPDVTHALAAVSSSVDVVVDCGRVWPGSPATGVLRLADVVWVVARPTADQLRPAAHRAGALRATGVAASLVLVGERPYGPDEVASAMGVEVAGVLGWDPVSADTLAGSGMAWRGLRRLLLARSAATLAGSLTASLPAPTPAHSGVGVAGEGWS